MNGKLSNQGTITQAKFGPCEIQHKFNGKRVNEVAGLRAFILPVEPSPETNPKR